MPENVLSHAGISGCRRNHRGRGAEKRKRKSARIWVTYYILH